ncbi:hypothetical protein BX666DRAFT_1893165 [Dichotomocladium elegans]|nr:hypothetical protein BX666DRAFT_1893165 [Dichotomocladium elegans]
MGGNDEYKTGPTRVQLVCIPTYTMKAVLSVLALSYVLVASALPYERRQDGYEQTDISVLEGSWYSKALTPVVSFVYEQTIGAWGTSCECVRTKLTYLTDKTMTMHTTCDVYKKEVFEGNLDLEATLTLQKFNNEEYSFSYDLYEQYYTPNNNMGGRVDIEIPDGEEALLNFFIGSSKPGAHANDVLFEFGVSGNQAFYYLYTNTNHDVSGKTYNRLISALGEYGKPLVKTDNHYCR